MEACASAVIVGTTVTHQYLDCDQIFRYLDKDGNGMITEQEWISSLNELNEGRLLSG